MIKVVLSSTLGFQNIWAFAILTFFLVSYGTSLTLSAMFPGDVEDLPAHCVTRASHPAAAQPKGAAAEHAHTVKVSGIRKTVLQQLGELQRSGDRAAGAPRAAAAVAADAAAAVAAAPPSSAAALLTAFAGRLLQPI